MKTETAFQKAAVDDVPSNQRGSTSRIILETAKKSKTNFIQFLNGKLPTLLHYVITVNVLSMGTVVQSV